ncbi:MAG TPA: aryl-sulfate sulfotransferase [Gemmatimonadaceae bacterium]|nr:aryl-sulfate sulfotransferase [Gemmatimonadaceae bacterium]
MRLSLTVSAISALVVAVACSDSSTSPRTFALAVRSTSVAPNPNNTLSAIVYFEAEHADSASVAYSASTDPGSATPWYRVANNLGKITVLGLLPNTTYNLVLRVRGKTTQSDTLQYTTDSVPAYVSNQRLTLSQGTFGPGFTMLATLNSFDTATAIAYDSIGRVRWYRVFPGFFSTDIKLQKNGHYTAALSVAGGAQVVPGQYVEFTPDGNIVKTYNVPVGDPDGHEFYLTGDSISGYTSHMWGYTGARAMDLSSLSVFGGKTNEEEYGHTLFRLAPNGQPEFAYTTWNYYDVTDWIEPTCCAPLGDFDHPNVLEFTPDSNYLLSFRNFGAIVKIDRFTGQKMWQIGGAHATFTIQNDPLGFFSGEHNVHFLPNGDLLVYDNGLRHVPQHTRVVEYALDETRKTATMVWEYEPQPMVFTSFIGSAERLLNGNTLVGFGAAGQVDEIDTENNLLARASFTTASNGKASLFYRAYRLPTLYKYQVP